MSPPTRKQAGNARKRGEFAFVVAAAASGALLLFPPVVLLGYTISVLDSVMRGEYLAWQSVVLVSYAVVGVPALLGLFLLVIPYALFRAAGRRLGIRQAVMWVGGTLMVWHVGVAAIWAWDATWGSRRGAVGDALPYPFAFGVAAVAILIATIVAEKRSGGSGRCQDGDVQTGEAGAGGPA